MSIQTGDIVLLAPKAGKATFFQRTIQMMGSVSTHNELIYVDPDGVSFVGCAHTPHFELIPLADRLWDCRLGDNDMLICRWHEWPLVDEINPAYAEWQRLIALGLRLLAETKKPYDKKAIKSIARTSLRSLFGWKPITKQKESAVYCTENVEIITRLAGTNIFRSIPKQDFYAPIHIERILRHGDLIPIANFGLMERIMSGPGITISTKVRGTV